MHDCIWGWAIVFALIIVFGMYAWKMFFEEKPPEFSGWPWQDWIGLFVSGGGAAVAVAEQMGWICGEKKTTTTT